MILKLAPSFFLPTLAALAFASSATAQEALEPPAQSELIASASSASDKGLAPNPSESLSADGKLTITLEIYGNDECPQSSNDIVVCARRPEKERYRIPAKLREKPADYSGDGGSWGSHVQTLEAASRYTRPNSCSVVGTGGFTGCTQAMLHQWFLERQQGR